MKGTNEPPSQWRELAFADDAWLTGAAPIGYDPSETMGTALSDMRYNYSSVYFRKTFDVQHPDGIGSLSLSMMYDDGFNLWINGKHVLRQDAPADAPAYNELATATRESGAYDSFVVPNAGEYLVSGANVIAVHLLNMSLGSSSDCFFDASVTAVSATSTGQTGPTPGARNAVYATNAPPQIRQVEHQPETPVSCQAVRITAKITDPDGVAQVSLAYQLVDPGGYLELTDAAYATRWTTVPMNDVGVEGDETAGDHVYTALLPGSLQTHRRLVRYRLIAQDNLGQGITVPYADDPQPNFAYFVYDGAPAWRGAIEPGSADATRAAVVEYGANVMNRLPVYHLISKQTSVENATWLERYDGDEYKWSGTLVYDGKVYDHIHYRARGGVWRYAMTKNMWKFDLNRGHDFQARDDYGNKYAARWTKLNLGSCIQQGDYWHRGEQGMFEAVGWRLFNLAGIEASRCNWIQFRVVDSAVEADPTSQYEGDFWGLYLALEQDDGRFLDEHGLPDGNFYKMEGGWGSLNNQGATAVSDSSDLSAFLSAYQSTTTDDWWRTHFDRYRYYNFRAIVEAIHHYDIDEGAGKNYFYYLNPDTKLWSIHPWDLDLTWADNMYGGGGSPFRNRVLNRSAFNLEYRNRIRELRDLLFNAEQTGRLIDECAARIYDSAGAPCLAGADRAMWDYNPKMANSKYSTAPEKAGKGLFYQFPTESGVTKSFLGTIQLMKKYVATRGAVLDSLAADTAIPATPQVAATGPANFPANQLRFQCSAFAGNGGQFAAQQWRLAELTPLTQAPGDEPFKYEINAIWDSGELASFQEQLDLASSLVKVGHLYRVRARFKDATGRWSHWSNPVEFTVSDSDHTAQLVQNLKLTEIMYHSPLGSEYDFIEFHNASATEALELNGVCFVKGIDYAFGTNAVIPANGYLVLTKATNQAAFSEYYSVPADAVILGPFSGSLDNSGETLTLKSALNGTVLFDFAYRDARGWPAAADGAGHSLVFTEGAAAGGGALNYGGRWRASAYLKGSPGAADPEPVAGLVLNEIALDINATGAGWVELYNAGSTAATFARCYLSDDPRDLFKWPLPAGSLAAGQWVQWGPADGVALSSSGGTLFLSSFPGGNLNRVLDAVACKSRAADAAWGRIPDGGAYWQPVKPTPGAANQKQTPAVLIGQIMFRPTLSGATNITPDGGFIGLYNPGSAPLSLGDTNGPWRLDGDVSLVFSTNVTLAAGAWLLVAGFDPGDPAQLADFKDRYGLGSRALALVGPFSGALNPSGGRLALECSVGQPASWAIVDEVVYSDAWPWPLADGATGVVLARANYSGAGSDPARWTLAAPHFTDSAAPVIRLQLLSTSGSGELRLRATGATSGQIAIERAADCAHWTPIFTNAVSEGLVDYAEKPEAQAWFYRARWLP